MANIYDAIVDGKSAGSYTLPSLAFAAGALNVYMRRGVYLEPADLVIPVGATLVGEHSANTIIDFANAAYGVRVTSGFASVQTTGTIAIVSGSATVTGTGTTFTNLIVGDCIQFRGADFLINAIVSDTQLTLESPYNGTSFSNVNFRALTMRSYDFLQNFRIQNSSVAGLALVGCRNLELVRVAVKNCSPNITLDNCTNVKLMNFFCKFSLGVGLLLNDSSNIAISMANIFDNFSHGISLTGDSPYFRILNSNITDNGGSGIYANGTNLYDTRVTGCMLKNNYEHGFYGNSSASSTHVTMCTLDENGSNGVNSLGSQMCVYISSFRSNVGNGVLCSGDSCVVGGCLGTANNNGVVITGSNNRVCDNNFTNATVYGCFLTNTSSENITTGNNFNGAGMAGYNDESTNSLQDMNKP